MSNLKKLIVILGPTASGKSELAFKLANEFNSEIINADSRQIYKEMLIGTGSPIKIESGKIKMENDNVKFKNKYIAPIIIENIPHFIFHIINPNEKFSVAEYKKLAVKIIKDIHKRGKLPILVGGTGLYISSIIDNLEIPKALPSLKIRNKLEKESVKKLYARLQKVDPKSANIIGPSNKRKLIRALEVYKITGKSFSSQQKKGKPIFSSLQIGIKIDRDELYKKIDQRVDQMIKNGLIEETKNLMKKYAANLPAMSGIGYKEIGQYLEGKESLKKAAQKIKFRTHQYARRQMTWFKRDGRINWVESYEEADKLVSDFIKA